jgi:hypothetical protein
MAVVNSELEAEILRSLYFDYGPAKLQEDEWYETTTDRELESTVEGTAEPTAQSTKPPPPETTQRPEPANESVHVGFHDIFIEGEYLTVRSK